MASPNQAQAATDAPPRAVHEQGHAVHDLRRFEAAFSPCMGKPGSPVLPDFPRYEGKDVQIAFFTGWAPTALNSHGYHHGVGRRASDGALFLAFIGGMDGALHLFGPVQRDWSCVRTAAWPGTLPDTSAQ
jgi:hypothetical protein